MPWELQLAQRLVVDNRESRAALIPKRRIMQGLPLSRVCRRIDGLSLLDALYQPGEDLWSAEIIQDRVLGLENTRL